MMIATRTTLRKKILPLLGAIALTYLMFGCVSTPTMPVSPTINCTVLEQVTSSPLGFRMSIQNESFAVGTLNAATGEDVIFSGSGTRQNSPVTIFLYEKHLSNTEQQVAITLMDVKSSQSTSYIVTNCAKHSLSTLILSGAVPTTFVVNLDLPQ